MSEPLPTDALWNDEERMVAEVARDAFDEVSALAAQADAELEPSRHAEKLSELYRALFERGLHRVAASPDRGGLGLKMRARVILAEELARADAGAALALAATWSVTQALGAFSPAVQERFLSPCLADETGRWLLAGAVTEPDRGSDAMDFLRDRSLGCLARPAEGGVALSGTKWMMSNGGAAAAYLVIAQREGSSGYAGRLLALVPADADGLSAHRVDKQGLRTVSHALVVLDEVKVPAEATFALPVPPGGRAPAERASVAAMNTEIAAAAVGVAQAIYDSVRAYALERRQGDKEIAGHQAVALRLSEMAERVAGARAVTWQSAALVEAGAPSLAVASAAKASAARAASRAAEASVGLVGAPALERSHPLSKLLRDAVSFAPAGGTLDFVRLLGAAPSAL